MCIKAGTIRQIHKALNSDGYRISENAIRNWIKEGHIRAVYCGRVAYISYASVVSFLINETKEE